VARECVRQSLVVLKNKPTVLPLSKTLKRLCVVGKAADDLGMQCGGWSISWQGESGRITRGGTTILEAIRQAVGPDTAVAFSPDGSGVEGAEAVIVVVGEQPYAEMKGDRKDLLLSANDRALVKQARRSGIPLVTVLLSGRPLVLGEALAASDAFVAAWLPGTEGQGVTDVLFGDVKPTGKLPRAWPGEPNATSVETGSGSPYLFPFGFGLSQDARETPTASPVKTASAQH
jgi:beta-glucosidase